MLFFFLASTDSAANCQMKFEHHGKGTSSSNKKKKKELFYSGNVKWVPWGKWKIMAKEIRWTFKTKTTKKKKNIATHWRRMQLGIIVIDFPMHITYLNYIF